MGSSNLSEWFEERRKTCALRQFKKTVMMGTDDETQIYRAWGTGDRGQSFIPVLDLTFQVLTIMRLCKPRPLGFIFRINYINILEAWITALKHNQAKPVASSASGLNPAWLV